jgi:hypothetical protein
MSTNARENSASSIGILVIKFDILEREYIKMIADTKKDMIPDTFIKISLRFRFMVVVINVNKNNPIKMFVIAERTVILPICVFIKSFEINIFAGSPTSTIEKASPKTRDWIKVNLIPKYCGIK